MPDIVLVLERRANSMSRDLDSFVMTEWRAGWRRSSRGEEAFIYNRWSGASSHGSSENRFWFIEDVVGKL